VEVQGKIGKERRKRLFRFNRRGTCHGGGQNGSRQDTSKDHKTESTRPRVKVEKAVEIHLRRLVTQLREFIRKEKSELEGNRPRLHGANKPVYLLLKKGIWGESERHYSAKIV